MDILIMIVIGFVVGLVARAIKPGRDTLGMVLTTILGICGSLIAGFAGRALGWYEPGEPAGFIAAIIGAVVLLFIVQAFRGNRRVAH